MLKLQQPHGESGLKRFWSAVRSTNSSTSSQCEQGLSGSEESPTSSRKASANCSLPLLQVWPSSDSPRGEADGQSFVFPVYAEDVHCVHVENSAHYDFDVKSQMCVSPLSSPSLLHPDHARVLHAHLEHMSMEDVSERERNGLSLTSASSSSTTSSLTSVASRQPQRYTDPATSMTRRCSLFDALDLEYALLRAAARGSVGPYSLSESLHKLTFTQSLAFPGLARGLATKRRRASYPRRGARPPDANDSGLNAFAKVVTALVLVLVSVLVFAVVYKFVRT